MSEQPTRPEQDIMDSALAAISDFTDTYNSPAGRFHAFLCLKKAVFVDDKELKKLIEDCDICTQIINDKCYERIDQYNDQGLRKGKQTFQKLAKELAIVADEINVLGNKHEEIRSLLTEKQEFHDLGQRAAHAHAYKGARQSNEEVIQSTEAQIAEVRKHIQPLKKISGGEFAKHTSLLLNRIEQSRAGAKDL